MASLYSDRWHVSVIISPLCSFSAALLGHLKIHFSPIPSLLIGVEGFIRVTTPRCALRIRGVDVVSRLQWSIAWIT
jgi:hypothetical protein